LETYPFDFEKRQEELIENTIIFVYNQLSEWRDDPMRPNKESEKQLNTDLPKFLTSYARNFELNVNFFSEEPQGNNRTVDLVACYYDKDRGIYNVPITVFECKRLTVAITGERKDEYVTGHEETGGGIQRFKLEVHGKEHEIVGMIGYVQTGTCPEWLETINTCIDDLSDKPDENGLCWTKDECIATVDHDEKNGKYYGKSLHQRKTRPKITIHHLWVNMQEQNIV
jgi:hypothetical protein